MIDNDLEEIRELFDERRTADMSAEDLSGNVDWRYDQWRDNQLDEIAMLREKCQQLQQEVDSLKEKLTIASAELCEKLGEARGDKNGESSRLIQD